MKNATIEPKKIILSLIQNDFPSKDSIAFSLDQFFPWPYINKDDYSVFLVMSKSVTKI